MIDTLRARRQQPRDILRLRVIPHASIALRSYRACDQVIPTGTYPSQKKEVFENASRTCQYHTHPVRHHGSPSQATQISNTDHPSNQPHLFLRDPIKTPSTIPSQKRKPITHAKKNAPLSANVPFWRKTLIDKPTQPSPSSPTGTTHRK